MTNVEKFNEQTITEEILNSTIHGVGALLTIAGTIILIIKAFQYGEIVDIVSSAIYGGSLILLYTMSTLYHSMTNRKAKKVFQIFDHCSVFILIMGSYVPITLALLGGTLGWTLFWVNLVCTVAGITANIIDVRKYHKLSLCMYLIMGWSVIFFVKPVLLSVGIGGFLLLLFGGIFYSVGVFFYQSERRFMHSIWHLFVCAGSIFHYFFVLFYIIIK